MRENDKEGFRGALLLHVSLAVFGCHLLVCSLCSGVLPCRKLCCCSEKLNYMWVEQKPVGRGVSVVAGV